jgi:hypothetical protein
VELKVLGHGRGQLSELRRERRVLREAFATGAPLVDVPLL